MFIVFPFLNQTHKTAATSDSDVNGNQNNRLEYLHPFEYSSLSISRQFRSRVLPFRANHPE